MSHGRIGIPLQIFVEHDRRGKPDSIFPDHALGVSKQSAPRQQTDGRE
jgi:hypothetical protein